MAIVVKKKKSTLWVHMFTLKTYVDYLFYCKELIIELIDMQSIDNT